MKNTDAIEEIESDFGNLARLAAASVEDVLLYLAKLMRKYCTQRPELATGLDQSLKSTHTRSSGPCIVRKGVPEISLPDLLPQDAARARYRERRSQ